ncbi:MAG: penicillin-binding transpeptidase domain-containing protein, partial [Alphaproteobacteria bacterium]|nr:penicillin-binding transpeptidase domain-containing protein [Alphaproteobacteria bacterium]
MSKDNEKAKIFTRRALLLGGAQALLFSVIAGRLYYLQIVQGRMYRRRAENNRISVRIILPKRGRILDRYGVPLAINDQTFRVVILPSQVKKVDELLDKLSKFVTIEESDRKRIERDLRTQNDLNSIIVKDNISREQMDSIAVSSPDLIGADVDSGEVRVYPYGEITAHILGYVGAVAKEETDTVKNDIEKRLLRTSGFLIGKKGMEKAYEMKMRGISGTKEMEVNARGNVVRALSRREPVSGEDVQLSLDINLQQLAAARISHTIAASAVVMNIHTGEILAMVSRPSFDPNLFSFGISKKNWDILNNDTKAPLMNRAISGVYAPGSTFKMMTALAALEARVMEYGERVYCSGSYEFGERKFHCWKRDGHGRLNLIEAIA